MNALLLKGKISFFQSAGRLKFDEKGHTPVKHGLWDGEPEKHQAMGSGTYTKIQAIYNVYVNSCFQNDLG